MIDRNFKVDVERVALIDALKASRELHQKEYTEAMKGWRKELRELCEATIQDIDGSEGTYTSDMREFYELNKPNNHDDEFKEIISMLSFSDAYTVQVNASQYAAWVENRWGWRDDWFASNSKYLGN